MPSIAPEPGRFPIAGTHNRPYQFPEQRQIEILRVIDQNGRARTVDLAAHLGVSHQTVARDLNHLNRLGFVIRIRGGAVAGSMPDAVAKPGPPATSTDHISAVHDMMADHAASLVRPGTTIAIGEGVTAVPLARRLVGMPDVTVVTNSIPVSTVFAHAAATHNAVLTGGTRGRSGALVGPPAETLVRSRILHQCFLSPYGMKKRIGFTAVDLSEAAFNRALIGVADTTVILADHRRWNMAGVAVFGPLCVADVLISDGGLPPVAIRTLECEVDAVDIVDGHALS